MVFFYPVYSNKSKNQIKYVYTSKNPTKFNKLNPKFSRTFFNTLKQVHNDLIFVPGMCFSENGDLLVNNNYNVRMYKKGIDESTKYKLIDGTTVFIYKLNGELHLGTSNSWDITNIKDISNKTYGDYLEETINKVNFNKEEEIKEGETLAIIFSNPKIHFMAEENSILVYNDGDLILYSENNRTLEDLETEEESDFFTYNGTVYIRQSREHKEACNLIYFNRKKFNIDEDGYDKMFACWYGMDTDNILLSYLNKEKAALYDNFIDHIQN